MTRQAQTTIDGYTIQHQRARMTGSLDLEDQDATHFITGDVIVGVFVGKVEGPSIKEDRHGDITRTSVTKVTDVRVLTGKLKTVLVEKLGLAGMDTMDLPVFEPIGGGRSIPPDSRAEAEDAPVAQVSQGLVDTYAEGYEEDPEAILAPRPDPVAEELEFTPASVQYVESSSPQTIGQIRPPQDAALRRFLGEV